MSVRKMCFAEIRLCGMIHHRSVILMRHGNNITVTQHESEEVNENIQLKHKITGEPSGNIVLTATTALQPGFRTRKHVSGFCHAATFL